MRKWKKIELPQFWHLQAFLQLSDRKGATSNLPAATVWTCNQPRLGSSLLRHVDILTALCSHSFDAKSLCFESNSRFVKTCSNRLQERIIFMSALMEMGSLTLVVRNTQTGPDLDWRGHQEPAILYFVGTGFLTYGYQQSSGFTNSDAGSRLAKSKSSTKAQWLGFTTRHSSSGYHTN